MTVIVIIMSYVSVSLCVYMCYHDTLPASYNVLILLSISVQICIHVQASAL